MHRDDDQPTVPYRVPAPVNRSLSYGQSASFSHLDHGTATRMSRSTSVTEGPDHGHIVAPVTSPPIVTTAASPTTKLQPTPILQRTASEGYHYPYSSPAARSTFQGVVETPSLSSSVSSSPASDTGFSLATFSSTHSLRSLYTSDATGEPLGLGASPLMMASSRKRPALATPLDYSPTGHFTWTSSPDLAMDTTKRREVKRQRSSHSIMLEDLRLDEDLSESPRLLNFDPLA